MPNVTSVFGAGARSSSFQKEASLLMQIYLYRLASGPEYLLMITLHVNWMGFNTINEIKVDIVAVVYLHTVELLRSVW